MANQLEIVIKAKDEASKVIEGFADGVGKSMLTASVAAGTLAAGALAIGGAFVKSLGPLLDYAEGLEKANLSTGVSVEYMQKLIQTGDGMGISFDQTRGAIERMSRNLEGSGAALRKFGIDVGAFAGLNADEKFRAMAAQIMAIQDPTERAAVAMAAFGKSGAGTIPLLAAVVSGVVEVQKVLGTDTVAALNRVDKALDGAKTSWKLLQQEVVAFIAMKLPLEDFFTIMSLGFQNLSKGPQILAAQWVGAMEAITHGNLSVGMAAMEMYLATGKQTEQLPKLSSAAGKVTEALRQANIAMDALVKKQAEQEKANAKATKTLQAYEKGLLAAEEAARKAAMGGEQDLLRAWEDVDKAAAAHTNRMMDEEEKQIKAAEDAADKIIAATKKQLDEEERMSEEQRKIAEKEIENTKRRQEALAGTFGSLSNVFGSVREGLVAMGVEGDSAMMRITVALQTAATAASGFFSAMAKGDTLGMIGSAIGGVVGALSALGVGGNKVTMQVNDMRDAFFKAHGGFAAFSQSLVGLTNQDLTKKIFDAKTVESFNAAVAEAMNLLDTQKRAQEDLNAAVEKYGFTIEELGPKFAQQKLDEQAGQLLKDFQLLSAAGVDVNAIIARMGPSLVEFVNTSIAAGATIPEAMRPMVDQLIQSGQLLDENGNAFASAEEAGITFAQSLTESMQSVIEEIRNLVAALTGIPRNVTTTVTTHHQETYGGGGGGGGEPGQNGGMARGGIVLPFIPRAARGIVSARPGGSPVLVGEGGQAELVAPVAALADRIGRAAAAAAGGGGPRIVQVVLDGRVVAESVERQAKAGAFAIPASSVRR